MQHAGIIGLELERLRIGQDRSLVRMDGGLQTFRMAEKLLGMDRLCRSCPLSAEYQ
jgi:hypothetical protein